MKLVADEKNDGIEDQSGKGRAALSELVNARIDGYLFHHDKVIVSDHETVEVGSFQLIGRGRAQDFGPRLGFQPRRLIGRHLSQAPLQPLTIHARLVP